MADNRITLASRVAGEVRAELARQQRPGTWMAKQMGMTQSAWSRRVTGDLPFDIDQLDRVAAILQVPISQFLQGARSPDIQQWPGRNTSDDRRVLAAHGLAA